MSRRREPRPERFRTRATLLMLIDSHCHLDFPDFADDLDGVVERAGAAGVGAMVTISTEIAKFPGVLAVADDFHLGQ